MHSTALRVQSVVHAALQPSAHFIAGVVSSKYSTHSPHMSNLSLWAIAAEVLWYIAVYLRNKFCKLFRFQPSQATSNSCSSSPFVMSRSEITKRIASEAVAHSLRAADNHAAISIIVPTYNEETSIRSSIESVFSSVDDSENLVEVIISDGGSTDSTIAICQDFLLTKKSQVDFRIFTGGTNRGESQNIGAREARGDILLFLHADTILPPRWMQHVREAAKPARNLAGCFEFKLFLSNIGDQNDLTTPHRNSSSKFPQNISYVGYVSTAWRAACIYAIVRGTNARSRYFQLPYGDQALFFRRGVFLDCFEGFPSTEFMEDYDLIKEVRKYGSIVTVAASVKTSARRWERNGFIWNTVLNQVSLHLIFQHLHRRAVKIYSGSDATIRIPISREIACR